jgi:phosphate transport system permease protein
MAVAAPPEARGSAGDPPGSGVFGGPGGDTPIRPRSFHPVDGWVLAAAMASSFALVWIIFRLMPVSGSMGFLFWWFVSFAFIYWLAMLQLEGPLVAKDRLMAVLIITGTGILIVPLVTIIVFVTAKGIAYIRPHVFVQTNNLCGQLNGPTCGGIAHAIVGTLEQVAIAMIISVPLAVLCAVYLNEIGGPVRRPVRLFVDAMSGVPSIVAGLFIYAVVVVSLGWGFSGFAAALALSILMLPTVTRTSEEVLRLVPDGLREGSLALGAYEWRTVWNVVLPTARSGLITAVILGVARAVGETAPVLLTAFGAQVMNGNPFHGPQESVPLFIWTYIRFNPGSAPYLRAWMASFVLIVVVLGLFTLARVLGSRTSIERKQKRAAKRATAAQKAAARA